MKVSYKEMMNDLDVVLKAQDKDPMSRYSVDIEGELKTPPALKVLSVIDSKITFEEKAQFVKELLGGCRVTIYKDDKKSFDVGITQGVEWWAIDGFNQDPMALRFLIVSVFTKFLKKYMA